MNKLRRLWVQAGQPAIFHIIGIVALSGMLFFRLGTLAKPFTAAEYAARSSSTTINQIIDNPVNAPHKAGQYVLQKTGHRGPLAMRSVSALFGLLAVILFFLLARTWFETNVAVFGSILFATSTFFLHTARVASPDVLQPTALLALAVCGLALRFARRRSLALGASAATVITALYIPGMVWFVALFAALQRRILAQALRQIPAPIIILTFFGSLVLLGPLIFGLIGEPGLLRTLAGLPGQLPTPADSWRHIMAIPEQLFLRGPSDPGRWLARLPVIDLFGAVMLVLGTYHLAGQRKLDRTRLLFIAGIASWLLAALQGPVTLAVLLPVLYFVITYGMRHHLRQWYSVFPRNPFARYSGLLLLGAAFALCVSYNISRYFIAWPVAPPTRQAHDRNP